MIAACPCCTNRHLYLKRVNDSLETSVCSKCGLFLGHFTLSNGEGAGYAQLDLRAYERSIGQLRTSEASTLVSRVRRLAPQPAVWLDLGCGAGRLLQQARSYFKTLGVEPDGLARSLAQAASPETRVAATLSELALPDGSVTVVSMLDVLEHIEPGNLQTLAREVLRSLSTGGLWLIKVPSSDGLFFRCVNLISRLWPLLVSGAIARLWLLNYPSPHYEYFNDRSLRCFLQTTGFETLETFYLPTLPVYSAFSRLTLDSSIPKWKAVLALPLVFLLTIAERLYGRTDSLVAIARKP
ncbi:MAG TPA: class I SAM-dependent methyltransferase, partial [Candidatus Baltobacteraceae bacterium]|nr:class I SAM-dependent methyltransferase [Candidatus Baltobacteraceae bacterium]